MSIYFDWKEVRHHGCPKCKMEQMSFPGVETVCATCNFAYTSGVQETADDIFDWAEAEDLSEMWRSLNSVLYRQSMRTGFPESRPSAEDLDRPEHFNRVSIGAEISSILEPEDDTVSEPEDDALSWSQSSSPTKAVRFTPLVTCVSRPCTPTEAWSLYHFEVHARKCPECYDPLGIYLRGGSLCDVGHALAQDVALHFYQKAGEVYSHEKDQHKHVRVELPPGYDQVRGLLKGMDRAIRSGSRTVPVFRFNSA